VDLSQVFGKCLGSCTNIFSVETEWKLPSLNLTASISIIFTWCEPVMWVCKLDVSKERDLVDWSIFDCGNGNLFIWSVNLESKGLSDITSVGPYKLLLITTIVSHSSVVWWQNTGSI